ncbi:MAG TPA: Flp family type IVb pilin [Bacillales bacterium]|nr:Flp family type IVb pilin [Bacillales bacterium]
MVTKLIDLFKDEKGQGMTEYGLVLGVIAVGVIGILVMLREQIIAMFKSVLTTLTDNNGTTTG